MNQLIRKHSDDIIHIYYGNDKELWSVVRPFDKGSDSYTVICEYHNEMDDKYDGFPAIMTPGMVNNYFNHDIISLFND